MDADFLARIDRHMERGNELMAEVREEMRLSRAQAAEHARLYADLRQFTRELVLRVDRTGREEIRALRDLREESRAQTQALLRVIDRMDRLDPGGAAA